MHGNNNSGKKIVQNYYIKLITDILQNEYKKRIHENNKMT